MKMVSFKKKGLIARTILIFSLVFHLNQAYELEREDGLDCSKCPTAGGTAGVLLPTTVLQLCIVLDNSVSFAPYKAGILSGWPFVMAGIGIYHALTDLGLVSFLDWPEDSGAETDFVESLISLGHNPEACYQLLQPFSVAFLSAAEFALKFPLLMPQESSGGRESSLAAIAFAASDPDMNWDLRDEPLQIQRLFLLLTDADYGYNLTDDDGDRDEFKGDGTDSCQTSLPPTPEKVGELLTEMKMGVLALLPPGISTVTVDTATYYRELFERMPHVPYCGLGIDLNFLNPEALLSSLLDCFVVLFGLKQESEDCCVEAVPTERPKFPKPTRKTRISFNPFDLILGGGQEEQSKKMKHVNTVKKFTKLGPK